MTEQQHTPEPWTRSVSTPRYATAGEPSWAGTPTTHGVGPGLWPPLLIGSPEKAAGVVVGVLTVAGGALAPPESVDLAEANARRIVAAINACAGWTTARLEEWAEMVAENARAAIEAANGVGA